MNKTTENKLRKIAEGQSLTDADKALVVSESEKLGLTFEPKTGCSNCYSDQAVLILQAVRNAKEKEGAKESEREFILRNGIDVIFCGYRINAETLTDELGRKLMMLGFPTKFFVKYAASDC